MKRIAVIALLALACLPAQAGVVKSLALDHLAELDKVIAADAKALAALRDPDANQTMIVRDQNLRYIGLQKKFEATFGDKPGLTSEQGACVSTLMTAHDLWSFKVNYAKSRSNFDKETVDRFKRMYGNWRKSCNEYLKSQK